MGNPIVAARHAIARRLDAVNERIARITARRETRAAFVSVVLAAAIAYPIINNDPASVDIAVVAEVYVLLALGLNIVVGFAGLLDLGYAAFFAIGAYTLALLGSAHFTPSTVVNLPLFHAGPGGIHVNFFLMIPISALVAATCGVLFGAPTLRLRGDYLAIVTLGFGEIVPKVIQNLGPDNSLGVPNITNGVNRIVGIDSPPDINFGGTTITFVGGNPRPWYYFSLIIIALSVVVIYSLRSSRLGRAWAAIREDEVAAAHMGINITRTRLLAFGLGAAFSGFAGLIEASRIGSVDYTQFSFQVSITILVMVILGGMGSIPGAILGAILLSYLDLTWLATINGWIHNFGGWVQNAPGPIGTFGAWLFQLNLISARPLIYGIVLVGMMLLRPQGLWPSRTRARELEPQTAQVLEEENQELYTARTE